VFAIAEASAGGTGRCKSLVQEDRKIMSAISSSLDRRGFLASAAATGERIMTGGRPRPSSTPINLTYFNEVDKGGHFAAREQPELFSAELRAAFRSLRQSI
jgi:hypothetical protein